MRVHLSDISISTKAAAYRRNNWRTQENGPIQQRYLCVPMLMVDFDAFDKRCREKKDLISTDERTLYLMTGHDMLQRLWPSSQVQLKRSKTEFSAQVTETQNDRFSTRLYLFGMRDSLTVAWNPILCRIKRKEKKLLPIAYRCSKWRKQITREAKRHQSLDHM